MCLRHIRRVYLEKEMLQLISRNEDKLFATMTDAQKELFFRYTDCVRGFQALAECLLFQNSFRPGARIMHRGLCGGWSIDADEAFSPGILCGLFAFCRYMEHENEFMIV